MAEQFMRAVDEMNDQPAACLLHQAQLLGRPVFILAGARGLLGRGQRQRQHLVNVGHEVHRQPAANLVSQVFQDVRLVLSRNNHPMDAMRRAASTFSLIRPPAALCPTE